MLDSNSVLYRALYDAGEDGLDLHAVQLLEDVPRDRLAELRGALQHELGYVRFHATLVLVAWGDDSGLEHLGQYLDAPESRLGLSPHRLGIGDVYMDELGDALLVAVHLSRLSWVQAVPFLQSLLGLYREDVFDGKLAHALASRDFPAELTPVLTAAIAQTFAGGNAGQASQLLPALARSDPSAAWALIQDFEGDQSRRRDYGCHLAESLQFIDTDASQQLARALIDEGEPIATFAKRSLAVLQSDNL